MDHAEDGSQIVFFDVEIETIYSTSVIVEFGAIFVCPNTLTELRLPYSTFVRPANPSLIPAIFKRRNGINRDSPTFADIADTVYELLHERIWAGHDIVRFDCMHITKAFSELNRPPPEPKAIIDSLPLFTDTFGRRADDMKMASLATYFGLGQQTHRSLDDVRMNLEVLKHCATVLFLGSSLSDIFTVSSGVSPNATPRSRGDGKSLSDMKVKSMLSSPVAKNQCKEGKNNPTSPIAMCSSSKGSESNTLRRFDMHGLRDELNKTVVVYEEPIIPETPPQKSSSSSSSSSVAAVSSEVVLEPEEISISCLAASFVPLYRGSQMIQLLHKGVPFQLRYACLKIRFGINGRFQDHAGRPKLSFVVDLDPSQQILCKLLETLDGKAQRLCLESGSSSDWRPVVTRKDGFYPTVRLQIPRAESGNGDIYGAEIFERESSGNLKRKAFDKFDVAEVASLFKPGAFVSGVFSFDSYDYQQSAGIRLIAQTLVTHSN